MGSIVKVTNGKGTHYKAVYELPAFLDGTRRRTSKTFPVGTTLATVKKFLAEKGLEKARAGNLSSEFNLTFEQFTEIYFQTYTKFLSPTTLNGYRSAYNNSKKHGLKNYFGNIQLRKITQRHVQEYVNYLSTQVSPKSTKNYLMLLNGLFKLAVQQKIISRENNPMYDIIRPKQRRSEVEAYNFDEFNLLLKLSKEDTNPDIELIIHLALLTGIRRGEMAALLWDDVNFSEGYISINKSRIVVDGKEYTKEPKTSAGKRRIYIPQTLIEVLKKYKERYDENKSRSKDFKDKGYVVSKPNGEPFSPQGISNNYLRFMNRHSDDIRFLKFHGLRHTYASILIANEENPKTVQHNLGHSDVALTLQIYSHSYESSQKSAAMNLDKAIISN